MKKYDAIIIGAGHNGLTNATYLAKAGLNTLVIEKNDYIGGARGFFKYVLEKVYPFKNIFIRQLSLTSFFKQEKNLYKSKYFEQNYFY